MTARDLESEGCRRSETAATDNPLVSIFQLQATSCSSLVALRRGPSTLYRGDRGIHVARHPRVEEVHTRKAHIVQRGRDTAYTNAPRQSASLHRNSHTVLLRS